MKKSLSLALLFLAVINIFAICATSSYAENLADVIPVAPQNFVAVNSATGISITWEQVEDTAGYKIYRKASDGEYEEIADVKGFAENSFTDISVISGMEYKYCIKAYNAFNEGELSEESTMVLTIFFGVFIKKPKKVYKSHKKRTARCRSF